MTTASVQAVVDVGGAPVGRLMDRVELRMAELATGYGPVLARYAGETIAAGGKRLRPLLVCIAARRRHRDRRSGAGRRVG
jgi:geranylgeranyl pyrophosphate synthase